MAGFKLRETLLLLSTALLLNCSPQGAAPTPQPQPAVETPFPQPTAAAPTPSTEQKDVEVLVEGQAEDITVTKRVAERQVNIEFILDASGSMLELIGDKTRLQTAKDVLTELLRGLPAKVAAGLRVYGHRYPEQQQEQSCSDVELLHAMGTDREGFLAKLSGIQAKGWTPLAKSIEMAAADMPAGEDNVNNVILISDGEETCGGDPSAVAKKAKQGPGNVTVHTISFAGNDKAKEQLQQIAQESGGTYREAEDGVGLLQALQNAVAQRGAFVRVEVRGENGREVSSSVVLRNPVTGENVHQFNSWLDAPVTEGTFDIIVGTAPRTIYRRRQLDKDSAVLIKLTTGALRVDLSDSENKHVSSPVELRDSTTGALLRNFPTWYNQSVLPGTYDLLITTPNRIRRKVQISMGKLSVVEVGTGVIRIELNGMGGNHLRTLVQLRDPITHEPVYTISTWNDQQVLTGTYDLEIENVLGGGRNQITMDLGERKSLSLSTGLLRVETNEKGRKQTVPAVLVDPSSKKIVGEFNTWEDSEVLTGDYLVAVKTNPEVQRAVTVEGNKEAVVSFQ